jgi:hypothetical protein
MAVRPEMTLKTASRSLPSSSENLDAFPLNSPSALHPNQITKTSE